MEIDCYKLLGISPKADDKTIRKAWRIKTKEVHPDINQSEDAGAKFRELSAAMEILLDSVSRLKHDRKFGYYSKIKNKDSNVKQAFSDYQKSKAETLVNEWTSDSEIAMAMQEKQRKMHLARHRRNITRLWVILGFVFLIVSVVLIYC